MLTATGDMKPYAYYTGDLGKTWIALATDDIKGSATSSNRTLSILTWSSWAQKWALCQY